VRFVLLLCASLLSGCATLSGSTSSSSVDVQSLPQLSARQQHLEQIPQWSVSARLSVRYETQAWSGQMRWQQGAEDYLININAPLGQGAMQLKSNPQFGVEMRLADGHVSYADNPQTLLYDFTGWQIPMSGLQYWLRGIPMAGRVKAVELDDSGRVSLLQQGDWQIQYKSYTDTRTIPMPRKLILKNGKLKIIVVVDHWNLEA